VSASTGATVTALVNGTSYTFRVKARNDIGDSGYAVLGGSATPGVLPGAPTGLGGVANAANRSVALSWTAPGTAGSPALTDYVVEYKVSGQPDSAYAVFADGVGTTPSATVTGLTSNTTYVFRVKAKSAVGDGVYSSTVSVLMPVTAPSAPINLAVASVANGQATLTWTAPTDNGGAAITDYVVRYKVTGQADSTYKVFADAVTAVTGATVTGLTNGVSYTFGVAAKNASSLQGTFATSAAATPWPQAAAPTRLTGTAGDGIVSLVWTAPTLVAGTQILDYIVQYRLYTGGVPGAWTTINDGVSALAKATIGLPNGSTYDFRVAAVTTGSVVGLVSATSLQLTPYSRTAVASAPTAFTATRTAAGSVQLAWTPPPANAGGPVNGYVIQYRLSTSTTWVTVNYAGSSPTTISRLLSGKSYVIRIAAKNLAGQGAFSSQVTATA